MGDKKAKGKKTKGNGLEVGGEVLTDARETAAVEAHWHGLEHGGLPEKPVKKYKYVDELARLQFELADVGRRGEGKGMIGLGIFR